MNSDNNSVEEVDIINNSSINLDIKNNKKIGVGLNYLLIKELSLEKITKEIIDQIGKRTIRIKII